MSKSSKGEGTKIAQAAKDLNVTSVTIRRYISEFNIETTADENGIKVLPPQAMDELHEIRKLKEDGLTNPQVLEKLEKDRAKKTKGGKKEEKAEPKKTARRVEKAEPAKKEPKKTERKTRVKEEAPAAVEEEDEEAEEEEEEVEEKEHVHTAAPVVAEAAEGAEEEGVAGEAGDGRSKHSLTCQTCGKVFEHMNPRLRDCLDCYRAKRKERRRGGDKHKNVIAHPLAQQVANKQQQRASTDELSAGTIDVTPQPASASVAARESAPLRMSSQRIDPLRGMKSQPVRNYRKAIEETRQITSNLKRRLERPDLPENERRWLEQIYAYQLILHQGWRHLAEYKAGNQPVKDRGEGEPVAARADRGEGFERGERGEREERGDRGDRGRDRDRGGRRFDRGDRGGRDRDRGERGERPERGERRERTDEE